MSKEKKSKKGLLFTIIYVIVLVAIGIYLWHYDVYNDWALLGITACGVLLLITLIINIVISLFKRKITNALIINFYLFLIPFCLILGSSVHNAYYMYSPVEIAKKEQLAIEKEKQAIANGKTVENTKRTVNEYGITIYGKIVGNAYGLLPNAPQVVQQIKERRKMTDEKIIKDGFAITYSEYYSDAYGGMVYLITSDKSGGIEIYNEKGDEFISGKKPQNDLEVVLANYRRGNAMAEAIEKKIKEKKK